MKFAHARIALLALSICLIAPARHASGAARHEVSATTGTPQPRTVTMTRAELFDKIKGGWAGQTIGVTYGGPTEFRHTEGFIGDEVEIPWGDPDYVRTTMLNAAGVYDDIYMDLTFVAVIDRLGIDAPPTRWPRPLPTPVTRCGTPTRRHATTYSTA